MTVLRNKRINKVRFVLFSLALVNLLLSSCAKRPECVLSQSEMEDVLFDLHLTEGVINALDIKTTETEKQLLYYDAILASHHTTQTQFDSSIIWYSAHPKRFEKIYLNLLARIEAQQEQFSISNLPQNINCPDASYWKTLGVRAIEEYPEEMIIPLQIILNQDNIRPQAQTLYPIPPEPNSPTPVYHFNKAILPSHRTYFTTTKE